MDDCRELIGIGLDLDGEIDDGQGFRGAGFVPVQQDQGQVVAWVYC